MEAWRYCVWILRANSITSPANFLPTDFPTMTTGWGTDCERVWLTSYTFISSVSGNVENGGYLHDELSNQIV